MPLFTVMLKGEVTGGRAVGRGGTEDENIDGADGFAANTEWVAFAGVEKIDGTVLAATGGFITMVEAGGNKLSGFLNANSPVEGLKFSNVVLLYTFFFLRGN